MLFPRTCTLVLHTGPRREPARKPPHQAARSALVPRLRPLLPLRPRRTLVRLPALPLARQRQALRRRRGCCDSYQRPFFLPLDRNDLGTRSYLSPNAAETHGVFPTGGHSESARSTQARDPQGAQAGRVRARCGRSCVLGRVRPVWKQGHVRGCLDGRVEGLQCGFQVDLSHLSSSIRWR